MLGLTVRFEMFCCIKLLTLTGINEGPTQRKMVIRSKFYPYLLSWVSLSDLSSSLTELLSGSVRSIATDVRSVSRWFGIL